MRRLAFLVAGFALIGFVSQEAGAVVTTTPFGDMAKVTEDLAQEFYRAWRLRISELPANYQQVATATGVVYRSPNKTGCADKNLSTLFQPVTEILVSSKIVAPGELREMVVYRGCSGEDLLIEVLKVKGTNPQSTMLDDVLKGKRRFMHSADETERHSVFLDPVLGPLIEVSSRAVNATTTSTRIQVMNKPLISIWTRITGTTKQTRVDLEDFDVRLSKFGGNMRSSTTGFKSSYTVFQNGDVFNWRLGEEFDFTNQRRFEEAYSKKVVGALNYSATAILEVYLKQMPKTEVAKPSAGANQRILQELSLALNRVTSNTELERVRLLIQEYIIEIQNGNITVDDRRPK